MPKTISPQVEKDIAYVQKLLPDHYTVQEGQKPGSIHCRSRIGIDDCREEDRWERFKSNIRIYFKSRYQEIFHNTCTNHLDFTIFLK